MPEEDPRKNGLIELTMNELAQRVGMDFLDVLEGNEAEHAEMIRQLRQGESVEARNIPITTESVTFVHAGLGNAQRVLENDLNNLRNEGLDIGRGSAEYGFKMPLPKKDEEYRSLIIFRR